MQRNKPYFQDKYPREASRINKWWTDVNIDQLDKKINEGHNQKFEGDGGIK